MDGAQHSDSVMWWIAKAAKEIRLEHGCRPAQIAVAADVDQGTITRFEKGTSQRPDLDRMIGAYAEVTGVRKFDIWRRAIDLWEQSEAEGS